MENLQYIILGITQGLTELLPISSSAHLVFMPWLLNFKDHGLGYDVALHLGTFLAVFIYYFKDAKKLFFSFIKSLIPSKRNLQDENQKMFWLIVIATIPAVIVGKILNDVVENGIRTIPLIATILFIMGIVLYVADKFSKRTKTLSQFSFKDALLIGLAQCLALIPGVSRSGSTMSAGLFLNFDRQAVAKFSFLMSLPITAGAIILKLPEFTNGVTHLQLFIGIFTSFISGIIAIKVLMKIISSRSFKSFAIYRMIAGLIILTIYFIK